MVDKLLYKPMAKAVGQGLQILTPHILETI